MVWLVDAQVFFVKRSNFWSLIHTCWRSFSLAAWKTRQSSPGMNSWEFPPEKEAVISWISTCGISQFPYQCSLNLLHQAVGVRLVTSAILGMTFCSITTESCASTRMRPAWIFSLDFPSTKPSVSFDELVFPESTRKWDSSDLKKSWNPFWIQPMSKSFILTNIPVLSSRSWRNSWEYRKT